MTVADPLSIDQVAVNEGRLLVAMTEVRPYAEGDTAVLVEDFRLKLNTYVHAIRTGQLADASPAAPVVGHDIVLFAADEPVPEVQEMIRVADEALAAESITVRWRVLDSLRTAVAAASAPVEEMTADELTVGLAQAVAAVLSPGWTHAAYRPAVIAGRSQDQLAVRFSNGTETVVEPPERARLLVPWLRHRMYQPGRGTWLSATFTLVSDGNMYPEFNYDDEPDWGRPVSDDEYAEELKVYPRDTEHLPEWLAQRLA